MLGQKFITNKGLYFKDLYIPSGIEFEIIETNLNWGEDENAVKVFFNYDKEHEELIQIMSLNEIREISMI